MVNLDDVGKNDLEEAHQRLTTAVTQVFNNGGLPFVVGGGNDQSFANWLALRNTVCEETTTIGVVNIDAHLDVRPLVDGT